jgi:hypothetical protein
MKAKKVLLDILNVSIYQQMGEKVAGVVSTELDQRMKRAVTGAIVGYDLNMRRSPSSRSAAPC